MITSAELQLIRDAAPDTALPGIDTTTGSTLPSSSLIPLSSLTTNPNAPFYYNPKTDCVYVTQNGAVLSGYDFGNATLCIDANNVTVENSTFEPTSVYPTNVYYSILQSRSDSGAVIENDTFTGPKTSSPLAAFIAANTNITISDNSFIDTTSDALHITAGTVTGNYFSGGGYQVGAHADAIQIDSTTGPLTISDNFIDWTNNANAAGATNSAIRIAAVDGNVSGVTIDNNVLIGGSYTIDNGGGTGTYTYSNINIDNNIIGFGQYGAFLLSPQSGFSAAGNQIVDYTNPMYSEEAWDAYLAAGISTTNLMIATPGVSIAGASTGSSTIYGDGTNERLWGTANETIFIGGYGTQYFTGGTGKDIYTYLSIADSTPSGGEDMINNFDPSKDVIDLSHIDANLSSAGVQNFTFIGTAAFSGAGGQVRYQQDPSTGYTYVEADLVGDSQPDLEIRLVGMVNLTAANFSLTAAQSAAATAPAAGVTSVADSAPSGDLDAGKVVTITLNFSGAVTLTGGVPTLSLNDGGTATYTSGSGTKALKFTYTVAAGQNTSALVVSGISLQGASIRDDIENNAVLTGAV